MAVRRFILCTCVAFGLWAVVRAADEPLRTMGTVTLFHLNVALPTRAPVANLKAIDYKQFTYVLYPTSEPGGSEGFSGDRPLMLRVADGVYDHRGDEVPIEFDVSNFEVVQLPRAPGGSAALVYGILYTGADAARCTGVVQMLEIVGGKLMLTDQITYNCRGGATARFDERKRQLTIESAHYAAGDPPCCPSQTDKVKLKLDGERIRGGPVAE